MFTYRNSIKCYFLFILQVFNSFLLKKAKLEQENYKKMEITIDEFSKDIEQVENE